MRQLILCIVLLFAYYHCQAAENDAADDTLDKVGASVKAAKDDIKAKAEELKSKVDALGAEAMESIDNAKDYMKAKWSTIKDTVKTATEKEIEKATTALKTFLEDAKAKKDEYKAVADEKGKEVLDQVDAKLKLVTDYEKTIKNDKTLNEKRSGFQELTTKLNEDDYMTELTEVVAKSGFTCKPCAFVSVLFVALLAIYMS